MVYCHVLLIELSAGGQDGLGEQLLASEKLQVKALSASTFLSHDDLRPDNNTKRTFNHNGCRRYQGKEAQGFVN
jgi:hypothetical protein